MGIEQGAIVLEVISFFLVTTDLFGEERLTALQERLRRWSQAIRRGSVGRWVTRLFYRNADRNEPRLWWWPLAIAVTLGLVWLLMGDYFWWWVGCAVVPLLALIGVFLALSTLGNTAAEMPAILLMPLVVPGMILVMVTEFLLSLLLGAAEWLLRWYVAGALALLVRFRLKGVLLVVGTVLFVASKVLAWLAVTG